MFHNKKSAKQLLAEANSEVEQISAAQAIDLIDDDSIVFVDVRETGEAEQGMVPGAVHAPRGMLEFYVDPESPMHKDLAVSRKWWKFEDGVISG